MKGLTTTVSVLVIAGSALALGAGFLSGRTYVHTALMPAPPRARQSLPEPVRPRELERTLRGAGSFDESADDPDRYGDPDTAVASRPAGWAHAQAQPRVAVIVVDPEREATQLVPLAEEPFPLAVAIAPDLGDALTVARDGRKTSLVACDGADLETIRTLRREGAAGIMCSTSDPARARALVIANGNGIVVDDLLSDDDALYRAARHAHVPAATRDIIADAHDQPGYVAFLLSQAIAVADRTGVAIVAVHARDSSRRALERFAARATRDGVKLVDVKAIASAAR